MNDCKVRTIPWIVVGLILMSSAQYAHAGKMGGWGDVKLSLAEPISPEGPFTFSVRAMSLIPFEDGRVILAINNIVERTWDSTLLWNGSGGQGLSLELSHILSRLPEGRYRVAAFFDIAMTAQGPAGPSDGFFMEVTEDSLHVSREDFRTQEQRKISAEIEARGLRGLSRVELRKAAPDLEARLRAMETVFPVGYDTAKPEETPLPEYPRDSTDWIQMPPLTPQPAYDVPEGTDEPVKRELEVEAQHYPSRPIPPANRPKTRTWEYVPPPPPDTSYRCTDEYKKKKADEELQRRREAQSADSLKEQSDESTSPPRR